MLDAERLFGEHGFPERLFAPPGTVWVEQPFDVKRLCKDRLAPASSPSAVPHRPPRSTQNPDQPQNEVTMPDSPEAKTQTDTPLTNRQLEVLTYIDDIIRERGYPPSVREIGAAVGLTSPSTVHAHLNSLQKLGYLRRDPTKPRAIEVRWEAGSGAIVDRRPVCHVPLVGDVAAGTGVLAKENVEEVMPLPADLTGEGELFMVRVRGDSMIDAGILDGDLVVARVQNTAENGDIVVAGIGDDEATIKTFRSEGTEIILIPWNSSMEPMRFPAGDVSIFGKVVTVMRKL